MSAANWLAIAFCVVGNVMANVGFKRLMTSMEIEPTLATLWSVIASPWAWLGAFGSMLLLGSYLYALRVLPLGVAYPLATSLGMVGVAMAGIILFSEPVKPLLMLGIAFVIVGVVTIAKA